MINQFDQELQKMRQSLYSLQSDINLDKNSDNSEINKIKPMIKVKPKISAEEISNKLYMLLKSYYTLQNSNQTIEECLDKLSKELVEFEYDINEFYIIEGRQTTLLETYYTFPSICQFLLEKGANLNLNAYSEITSQAEYNLCMGSIEKLNLFLKFGLDPNYKYRKSKVFPFTIKELPLTNFNPDPYYSDKYISALEWLTLKLDHPNFAKSERRTQVLRNYNNMVVSTYTLPNEWLFCITLLISKDARITPFVLNNIFTNLETWFDCKTLFEIINHGVQKQLMTQNKMKDIKSLQGEIIYLMKEMSYLQKTKNLFLEYECLTEPKEKNTCINRLIYEGIILPIIDFQKNEIQLADILSHVLQMNLINTFPRAILEIILNYEKDQDFYEKYGAKSVVNLIFNTRQYQKVEDYDNSQTKMFWSYPKYCLSVDEENQILAKVIQDKKKEKETESIASKTI